jgi:hypothetical protein|tara:strand:- start:11394 stop:11570 length:177 start_codon:yes stop_codon:yes gene_type:complete
MKNGCCCHHDKKGFSVALILIGVVYALQHKGMMFVNVTLWPWILIALGVVTLLFKHQK